jgi:HB1, ASXL, restriction endonuclease HTH domain
LAAFLCVPDFPWAFEHWQVKLASVMRSIAEAAERVLRAADHPLHSHEIVKLLQKSGFKFRGKFPDHSVQGSIWKHINESGNTLGFMMVGPGRRHRTYWLKGRRLPKQVER